MFLGTMLRQGGVSPDHIASDVGRNPLSLQKDLHRLRRETDFDWLMNVAVGNAVIVAVDFHVIIRMDPCLFPLREGKRFEGRGFRAGLSTSAKSWARVVSSFRNLRC